MNPRPTKPEEKDDWQHPTPRSIKTNTFTQHTDSQTQETQQNESADDLFEIYRDAPDRYTTTPPDKTNDENSIKLSESEQEIPPQNLTEPLPKNNFEPPQTQNPSEKPPESPPTKNYPSLMTKFKIISD